MMTMRKIMTKLQTILNTCFAISMTLLIYQNVQLKKQIEPDFFEEIVLDLTKRETESRLTNLEEKTQNIEFEVIANLDLIKKNVETLIKIDTNLDIAFQNFDIAQKNMDITDSKIELNSSKIEHIQDYLAENFGKQ